MSLTFSTHEVCEELVPLDIGQHWVLVHEVEVGDQSVFGVPPHHQHLEEKRFKGQKSQVIGVSRDVTFS